MPEGAGLPFGQLWIAAVVGATVAGGWLSRCIIGGKARALSESEERYRQQFRQSLAVMLIVDPENGVVVDANPAACAFYGYAHSRLLTLNIRDINASPPDELARCIDEVCSGSKGQFIARHRHCSGAVMDVEVFSNPLVFQGKTLLHSIVVDITGRMAIERELCDKTAFAENLILNSTTPTFVINSDHRVQIWNRALEELTGVSASEVIGTEDQWRAFYPSSQPCLADIVLDGTYEEGVKRYNRLSRSRLIPNGLSAEGDYFFDGRRCRLVFSSAPIRDYDGKIIAAIQTLEDVTTRISLEAQLIQAQKMESVGVLAGSMAHDFNNVLTVISGYADLLQLTLGNDGEKVLFAREISASVDRAAKMTRSLLAFSGKQELLLQCDDLGRMLVSIHKSLGHLIREDIALTVHSGDGPLPVYMDSAQIEQVLINLVINARDAMEPGGTISVSALSLQCDEARIEGNAVIPAGRYACLCVADNGTGMDATTLEHIFEPFFTTKERGKGTGLGLSIVHSIVARHTGYISVITAPGTGTEFRVYLPLSTAEALPLPTEAPQVINHNGTETVLVVEDDENIMKLFQEVLTRHGYAVLTAADGVEALEVFAAHRDEIQIALVDVILPRMNGREVVEWIRRQRPELPIIMTSGYADDIIDLAAINELRVVFLQKPIKKLTLLATLRTCLHTNL